MNERLKRFFLKIWKYLVVIVLILIAYVLYNYTNLFVVSDFKVIPLNAEKFSNINTSQILGNEYLKDEKKYFDLDINKVKEEVLGSSSFIQNVYVSKEFPNSTYIYVQERFPFVSLEIDSKKCILLDESGYVLDVIEESCKNTTEKYKTIEVKSDDPKITFTKNSKSSYFQIKKISDIVKVMNEYKVPVVSINISENIVTFVSTKDKKYIFSFNQDIDTQLARFIAVLSQLEKKKYGFKKIDFRFKRPVLTIK